MSRKDDLVVVKHNAVIESCYSLSVFESRIILHCIGQIDSMGELTTSKTFTLTANEIIEASGLSSNNSYRCLQDAVKKLYDRSVIIKLNENKTLETRWISSALYEKNEGIITIRFAHDMIPYLSEITKNFTKYRLNNILLFKSSYSIRIYELLMCWQGCTHIAEIDWLKEKFELSGKYSRLLNFKIRVINPAIEDINNFSDLTVSYTDIKQGRHITAFKFEWHPKKKTLSKPKIGSSPSHDAINEYSRINPQKTYGKSTQEVKKMMADDATLRKIEKKHGTDKSKSHTDGMQAMKDILSQMTLSD